MFWKIECISYSNYRQYFQKGDYLIARFDSSMCWLLIVVILIVVILQSPTKPIRQVKLSFWQITNYQAWELVQVTGVIIFVKLWSVCMYVWSVCMSSSPRFGLDSRDLSGVSQIHLVCLITCMYVFSVWVESCNCYPSIGASDRGHHLVSPLCHCWDESRPLGKTQHLNRVWFGKRWQTISSRIGTKC